MLEDEQFPSPTNARTAFCPFDIQAMSIAPPTKAFGNTAGDGVAGEIKDADHGHGSLVDALDEGASVLAEGATYNTGPESNISYRTTDSVK
jgi:hypothetical protein